MPQAKIIEALCELFGYYPDEFRGLSYENLQRWVRTHLDSQDIAKLHSHLS